MSLIVCLIHEAGHLTVMLLKNQKPDSVILRGGGIKIGTSAPCDSVSVLIAGSAVNIGIFAVMWLAMPAPYTDIYPVMFAVLNLCIGVFNLLPLGCLDGSRLLRRFLPAGVMRLIEVVTLLAVIVLLFTAFRQGGVNFTLAAAMIYVIAVDIFERLCYNRE
jgi:Zn-dependent protease